MSEPIYVTIAPAFRHYMTYHDVIKPNILMGFAGTANELLDLDPGVAGVFDVYVESEYRLRSVFKNGNLILFRNGDQVGLNLSNVRSGRVRLALRWNPNSLEVSFGSDVYPNRIRKVDTPYVLPPNKLLAWARKQSILPNTSYENGDLFGREVVTALLATAEKVRVIGKPYSFWDYQYGPRGRIIARTPKKEPNAQPTLELLLYEIGTAKNISFIAESHAGSGSLDFLATGYLKDGSPSSAAIEVKNAHSDDLIHGLTNQLPAYMRSKHTDIGIYCVLWYKGNYFSEPNGFDSPGHLSIALQRELRNKGLGVRIVTIDLSHPTSPSRG